MEVVSRTDFLALIASVAEQTRRLSIAEATIEQLRDALLTVKSAAVRTTMMLLNTQALNLTPKIVGIIGSHRYFGSLFVLDADDVTLYHLQAPASDREHENAVWKGKTSVLYLGGSHKSGRTALKWRQNILPKLMNSDISIMYPAVEPVNRTPIEPNMAAVVIAMQSDTFDAAALAEAIKAFGLGLYYTYIVCEAMDASYLEDNIEFRTTFRWLVDPYTVREQAKECYDIILYISRMQSPRMLLQTIDEFTTELIYTNRDAIFGGREPVRINIQQQLTILAHLMQQMPSRSDMAFVLKHAYAAHVFQRAASMPLLTEACLNLKLDMEAISVGVQVCKDMSTKDTTDPMVSSALSILFPTDIENRE